jgi:hypothetical protein
LLQGGETSVGPTALTTLDLSGNELTSAYLPVLCSILKSTYAGVSHLSLDDNDELIGHPDDEDGDEDEDDDEQQYIRNIEVLVTHLLTPASKLQSLSVTGCNLSSASALGLCSSISLFRQRTAHIPAKFTLNLNGNRLSADCVERLESMSDNVNLLDLDDNDEEDEETDDLKLGLQLVKKLNATLSVAFDAASTASVAELSATEDVGVANCASSSANDLSDALNSLSINK